MLDADYERLRHAAMHARGDAFGLGLGVLAGKGMTAWRRALTGLFGGTDPITTVPAAPACLALPSQLATELVNALTALTLADS